MKENTPKPRNEYDAALKLQNGLSFKGMSFGYKKQVEGEVVFNTAMTAYPESLTDPSYTGQILVATYPLIGNYGIPPSELLNGIQANFESDSVHIAGLVVTDYSWRYSHWKARESLGEWLEKHRVPAICNVDTRELTRILREEGCMPGSIIIGNTGTADKEPEEQLFQRPVEKVSTREVKTYGSGKHRIMLVDCGVKYNIIRNLLKYDTRVIQVPWDYDVSKDEYDGLIISNGPGDPQLCGPVVENLKKAFLSEAPIFGICLGSQLMGMASGGRTYKLKYGHRSHNQPVICSLDHRCYITSQNHGYALESTSLGEEWEVYFSNLNDGSCEGIRHKNRPFFATQFHPEASGGPTDTAFLFDDFMDLVKAYKS